MYIYTYTQYVYIYIYIYMEMTNRAFVILILSVFQVFPLNHGTLSILSPLIRNVGLFKSDFSIKSSFLL